MVSAIIAASVTVSLALLGFTWFLSANLATIKGKISSIERYLWGDKTSGTKNYIWDDKKGDSFRS